MKYLITKHLEFKDKTLKDFLVSGLTESEKTNGEPDNNFRKISEAFVSGSAHHKKKKSQLIGLDLVLPATVDMCEGLLGTDAAN